MIEVGRVEMRNIEVLAIFAAILAVLIITGFVLWRMLG